MPVHSTSSWRLSVQNIAGRRPARVQESVASTKQREAGACRGWLGQAGGTIWVASERNPLQSGAGQEMGRVHTLEIFLKQRPVHLS